MQAYEPPPAGSDDLLSAAEPRSSLSKVPRARLTTTGRPTSVSRYGMRAYPTGESDPQPQKVSTTSASRSVTKAPPEKKGLPLPILIGAGVLVLFIGVIVF